MRWVLPGALAAAIALAYIVTSSLGGEAGVAVLSGTDPRGAGGALLGLAHASAYFAAVVLAPPLAALGAVALLSRLRWPRGRASLRGDERTQPD